jgi:hypothetical protein
MEYNTVSIIITVVFFIVVIHLCLIDIRCGSKENFGALQSLYSNDGIQDAYLTIENDPDNPNHFDQYAYWRGVTWNLPTRNLNRMSYYPFEYDNFIDRYATNYPYW